MTDATVTGTEILRCSHNAKAAAGSLISRLHGFFLFLGLSSDSLPPEDITLYSAIVIAFAIFSYTFQSKRRKHLARELAAARAELHYLQEKLLEEPRRTKNKPVRIFMDGAFDMLHFGHMNAFRLARSLGTHLVVGVNSDSSIAHCKGAPLMNDDERLTMVSACKFVDQVVPDCPYIMSKEYLEWVIEKYNIDYVVHGSDPCIVDGKDVYATAKSAGKYLSIPRTEGVSTTDILGRMLLLTTNHHCHNQEEEAEDSAKDGESSSPTKREREFVGPQSRFFTTSRMLQLFSADVKAPTNDMRVIYVDGAWDMFHPGHVTFLKEAKKRGDYLLVGIHGDATVNRMRGGNLPVMNLHERVLSVLGCRYVSDVLIDAPYAITEDMIQSLKISEVVRGSKSDQLGLPEDEQARYGYVMKAGIYTVIPSPSSFNIRNIIDRIQKNQEVFQRRFIKKKEAESQYSRSECTVNPSMS